MTVLGGETERGAQLVGGGGLEAASKPGLTMGDRYITPEYLAHLPTSVSFFFG